MQSAALTARALSAVVGSQRMPEKAWAQRATVLVSSWKHACKCSRQTLTQWTADQGTPPQAAIQVAEAVGGRACRPHPAGQQSSEEAAMQDEAAGHWRA